LASRPSTVPFACFGKRGAWKAGFFECTRCRSRALIANWAGSKQSLFESASNAELEIFTVACKISKDSAVMLTSSEIFGLRHDPRFPFTHRDAVILRESPKSSEIFGPRHETWRHNSSSRDSRPSHADRFGSGRRYRFRAPCARCTYHTCRPGH
jgi:hypothetical protein